mgnify:CR=1 FL=1
MNENQTTAPMAEGPHEFHAPIAAQLLQLLQAHSRLQRFLRQTGCCCPGKFPRLIHLWRRQLLAISSNMNKFPQVLINIKDIQKEKLSSSETIRDAIKAAEQELEGIGRVLVRASGTESIVRVMVEANELQLAEKIADSLAQLVRLELK